MYINYSRADEIFLYDPKVTAYATSGLVTLSGTPTETLNKLVVNTAEFVSSQVFRNGALEFILTIPTAPAAGDVRSFGFKNANPGNNGKIIFDITDDALTAQIFGEDGTQIGDSYPITWDAIWTNTEIRCRIFYWERNCFFTINDTIVAKFEEVELSKLCRVS